MAVSKKPSKQARMNLVCKSREVRLEMSFLAELLYLLGILKSNPGTSSQATMDDSLPITKEFEYMLAEMNSERDLIDERQRRTEQVVAFYIAILTALIAAMVAGVTQTSGPMQVVLLLGACLLATATGHATFVRLLLKLGEVIASHSHFYARRQYFLDKFPGVRRYIEPRTDEQIKEVWRVHFNRPTVLFLRLFAFFNSTLLAVFVGGTGYWAVKMLQYSGWLQGLAPLLVALIAGTPAFIVVLIFELILVTRRIKRAREYSHTIFENLDSSGSADPQQGTPKLASREHK